MQQQVVLRRLEAWWTGKLAGSRVTCVVGVPSSSLPVTCGAPGELRARPGGRAPEATDQANGPVPPEEKKFCRYAVPTVPAVQQVPGKLTANAGGGPTLML